MGTYVTQFIPITVYLNIPDEVILKLLNEALDRRREKKYLQRILLKWQNLCEEKTTLNLIEVFINKCLVWLLSQNWFLLMPALLWSTHKEFLGNIDLKTISGASLHWQYYFIWMNNKDNLKEFMKELNSCF